MSFRVYGKPIDQMVQLSLEELRERAEAAHGGPLPACAAPKRLSHEDCEKLLDQALKQ